MNKLQIEPMTNNQAEALDSLGDAIPTREWECGFKGLWSKLEALANGKDEVTLTFTLMDGSGGKCIFIEKR